MDNGTRDEPLSRLAEAAGSVMIAHPTRVAVDGPPPAGKPAARSKPGHGAVRNLLEVLSGLAPPVAAATA
jgi:hypothetical protein